MRSRKEVREAIAEVISTVYAGKIFTSRYFDARDLTDYISVYFDSGELEHGFNGYYMTTAEVIVSVHGQQFSDDDLDEVAEEIERAINAETVFKAGITGILLEGFAYEQDERDGAQTINLRYNVQY